MYSISIANSDVHSYKAKSTQSLYKYSTNRSGLSLYNDTIKSVVLRFLHYIYIVAILFKIMEKCISNQLIEYINTYNILPVYQSDFCLGHSSELY